MKSESYIIVTGAGGAIGRAITRALAHEGHNVIMACRNIAKDTPTCQHINNECRGNVIIMELDLASYDSIRRFAHNVIEQYTITALINNAGVMNKHYATTHEGQEMTIGVNYIGAYLLTQLLAPAITRQGHIIFTTSLTRYIGKVDQDFFNLTPHNYSRFKAYSRSKLAITLLTAHLAEQLQEREIYVNASDPGIVDTDMIHMDAWFDPLADRFFRPLISTPEQGASSTLAALKSNTTGEIFSKEQHQPIPLKLRKHAMMQWLIDETNNLTAL